MEDVFVAVVPGPGQEGQDDLLGDETSFLVQATLDVAAEVHPGLEEVSLAGDALDYLVGLGELFLFSHGDFPVGGDFLGDAAEAKDG